MKRAVLSTVIALAALVGVAMAAAGSFSGNQKPEDPPLVDADPSRPPIEGTETDAPPPFTVPVVAAPPPGIVCPTGWRYFDNPVLHVGLCYPPGWGFTDFEHAAPLTELQSPTLGTVHLMSPTAFPWKPGTLPFDAIRAGVTQLEIGRLDPGARFASGCTPSRATTIGALSLLSCEEAIEDGSMRQLVVVAPLKRTPLQTHEIAPAPGTKLIVIARMSADSYAKEVAVAWQIVRTILPY